MLKTSVIYFFLLRLTIDEVLSSFSYYIKTLLIKKKMSFAKLVFYIYLQLKLSFFKFIYTGLQDFSL